MMSMTYSLAPAAIVPGLSDVDVIDVFGAIVELHDENQREQEMQRIRGELQSRWSK